MTLIKCIKLKEDYIEKHPAIPSRRLTDFTTYVCIYRYNLNYLSYYCLHQKIST